MFRSFAATALMLTAMSTVSVVAADAAPADAREPTDWATSFRDDMQAARRIILENHPGPADALNPGFVDWLDKGFEQQIALAESVDTAHEYVYAIQKFIGGFRDGHLGIRFDVDRDTVRWPGFFATWRNGTVVVHTVDPAAAPELAEGDRLQSCDGQTAEQLLRQRVFDFQFDPAIPASWVPAAARAFVDRGNPFVVAPEHCVFIRDDREIALDLEWRDLSCDDRKDDYDAARGRTRPDVGLYVPETGVYWLQASTFGPNEAQIALYQDAFRQLREARNAAKLVVLDLRGNNGGSSMWAGLFAEALWDESPDEDEEDASFVEWRVSEGNVAYWETLPPRIREQFGDSHPAYRWSNHVLRNLAAALENGQPLWRETHVDAEQESDDASTTEDSSPGTRGYRGTVVVLTDTSCGSACLDAMSLLTRVPEVVHVGSVTSADTQYMEARAVQLPSGLASLIIPIKVYRGRIRPDGGYFTPTIRFEGLHWTDEALRDWVLSLWHEGALDARMFVAVNSPPLTSDRASTGGVSFTDYDNDGDPDVYVTNGYDVSSQNPEPQANRFYDNSDGDFEALSVDGLTDLEGFSSGSVWADFDNDGDLDTFVANQRDQENVLLLQEIAADGSVRFVRHAPAVLAEDKGWSYSVAAADADNDGYVDFYVSNGGLSHSGVNFLYRNLEGKTLQRISNTDAVASSHASGGASWSDYDGDGDQDLVVANRPTAEMQGFKLSLFRNDGSLKFTRMDASALPVDATFPMSIAWGDVDNDGDQDLYAGNLYGMANNLYENLGDGTFRVMDGGRATTDAGSSYAVTFGDLDNDADLDLVVANWGGASEIYLNDGAGHFDQVSSAAFGRSIHYASSLALGDYDSDGDLDILIGNWPNHPGEGLEENVLIENRYAIGNWIRVALQGIASNRSAIGARIVIETATDGRTRQQIREVSTQSGWRSQGELTQHFGLGTATAVSKVVIKWPSGQSQTILDPPVNQILKVREAR